MKKSAQTKSSPGIFDCVFPEWSSDTKPYFETFTRSFYNSDLVTEFSEPASTALIAWGEIFNTTLENGMRVFQKGLDTGKASLKQDGLDPEPLFEAVDLATREINESFEAFLKNSPMAPALEAVEAMKSSLKIFEPEQDAFRKHMKKLVIFQLKISKMIKEWSDRSWTDAHALNADDQAWKDAVQEMIAACSELIKEMVDDLQMPEKAKPIYWTAVNDHTEMMEKALTVLATGSNLMNRTWRAAAESWGELFLPQSGEGDLHTNGFKAFQERYEQMVRKTVEESRIAEMLPQWVYTGHELNAAAGQLRNSLMFWPLAAETYSNAPASVVRKTEPDPATAPDSAEALAE